MRRALLDLACAVRLGFATNSSSTHSIVVLPRGAPVPVDRVPAGGDYGWEWFTLSSRTAKLDYLHAQIAGQVEQAARGSCLGRRPYDHAQPFALQVATEILAHAPAGGAWADVDHDSCFSHPVGGDGVPDPAFARWFRDLVTDAEVVILGGNDNESAPAGFMPPDATPLAAALPDDEYTTPSRVWDRGDHWLLWRRATGLRLRIPRVVGAEVLTTAVPELVDLKVTDWCDAGCAFCYQGSTTRGQHTHVEPRHAAAFVRALGVREVALGGGEPAAWPGLWEFVQLLQDPDDPVVNITTRRPDLVPTWRLHLLGGVGLSVDTAEEARSHLDRLGVVSRSGVHDDDPEHEAWARAQGNPWQDKLVLHVVLGVTPLDEVVEIMRVADDRRVGVLLLGYKHTGRGARCAPSSYGNWVDVVRDAFLTDRGWWDGPELGIDAVLAADHRNEVVSKLRVDPRLVSDPEGAFSLYVDLVSGVIAQHSYGATASPLPSLRDYRDPKLAAEHVVRAFRGWNAA